MSKKGLIQLGLLFLALIFTGCDSTASDQKASIVADPAATRTTEFGKLVGFKGMYGSHTWLGIPFAKPPIGELRWRKPQPPEAWEGTREALKTGSHCPQTANRSGGIADLETGTPTGDEDCLYLNIWAPQFKPEDVPASEQRLPVMVWIHGGGNEIGTGALYNGGNLATTHQLIVISLNYRLGPFGWFSLQALKEQAEDPEDRSGNFGTLDLIQALKWVRDNIAAFGGNPTNVTIFGESAGGYDIYSLLVSPYAEGLFHKAVVQSGGNSFSSVEEAESYRTGEKISGKVSSNEALVRMLIRDGKAENAVAALSLLEGMTSDQIRSYLKSKSRDDILIAFLEHTGDGTPGKRTRVYSNIRDGQVIPNEDPVKRMDNTNTYNEVPIILGTNRDEQKLFMVFDPKYVKSYFGLIFRIKDKAVYERDVKYMTDAWKLRGVDRAASAITSSMGRNVFAYRFDWDEEPDFIISDFGEVLGAAHGFEIPFVFGHFDLGSKMANLMLSANDEGRFKLAEAMMSYWAEFAYNGNPGKGRKAELPQWKPWNNNGDEKMLLFDTTDGGGIRMSDDYVTFEKLVSRIKQDETLSSQEAKCRMFAKMFYNYFEWDQEAYNNLGESGCGQFTPVGLLR